MASESLLITHNLWVINITHFRNSLGEDETALNRSLLYQGTFLVFVNSQFYSSAWVCIGWCVGGFKNQPERGLYNSNNDLDFEFGFWQYKEWLVQFEFLRATRWMTLLIWTEKNIKTPSHRQRSQEIVDYRGYHIRLLTLVLSWIIHCIRVHTCIRVQYLV